MAGAAPGEVIADGKYYRYRVVKVVGDEPSVKVGDVLCYRRAYGPEKFELVVDLATGTFTQSWGMEYIGPCWVENNKVVRTKDAPKKRAAR